MAHLPMLELPKKAIAFLHERLAREAPSLQEPLLLRQLRQVMPSDAFRCRSGKLYLVQMATEFGDFALTTFNIGGKARV